MSVDRSTLRAPACVAAHRPGMARRGAMVLAPGLAIGECRRPTTRLAATALERLTRTSDVTSVLDVGRLNALPVTVIDAFPARERFDGARSC